MKFGAVMTTAFAISACAGTMPDPDHRQATPAPVSATCDAAYAQHHIGDAVTEELGLVIRDETGARKLRWGPPNAIWTMDYREDRVNVRYDGDGKIIEITCG